MSFVPPTGASRGHVFRPPRSYYFVNGIIKTFEGAAQTITLRPYGWSLKHTEWVMSRRMERWIRRAASKG